MKNFALCFEDGNSLHCKFRVSNWRENLRCICTRLGLLKTGQKQQLQALNRRIEKMTPFQTPLVITGNFNDWRETISCVLTDEFELTEVFALTSGRTSRSFPSALSRLHLDRIYIRNLDAQKTNVNYCFSWSKASDYITQPANLIRA